MSKKAKLEVRPSNYEDIEGVQELVKKVYRGMGGYSKDSIRGQMTNFPEGNLVVLLDGKIVGYSACIILKEQEALKPHTWYEATGGGFGTTHNPKGEYLYGYETCVDPEIRRHRIGARIYAARKRLAKYLRLKGIVFGGRVPNFHHHIDRVKTLKSYIKAVKAKKLKDPTLEFHLRNGFEPIGILENYLPIDNESLGHAVHLMWKNPEYVSPKAKKSSVLKPHFVRVVSVQYKQRSIKSFKEFANMVEYYVDVTSDYKADFVLFPELFTMQLLSIKNEQIPPNVAIEHMTQYADRLKDMFYKLAIKYNVNIIGGSHPTVVGDHIENISYIALRNGVMHEQSKIHPTPDERFWWNFAGGNEVKVMDTDCGPIGVLICYDSEFPELARHLVNQGALILFVPFLTDNRQAYCRVRYCCQARAVENQIYVATAGNVGNLPRVANMDIQYAQSSIFTPCDFPFAKDGIAAETTPNVEMVAIADLRLDTLMEARASGAVKNLMDRRHDLYSVTWHK
ncbi:MAG: carbon-nitrogen hydrolase family protein [Bdellovibrionales bacterium]|nr:carbon-nitrogen hydrolase family protein [Bdellovibrionales bacterium]